MASKLVVRHRPIAHRLTLVSAVALLCASGAATKALAQQAYQSTKQGPYQFAVAVDGLPTVYVSDLDSARYTQTVAGNAELYLKKCDKAVFDAAINFLRGETKTLDAQYRKSTAAADKYRQDDRPESAAKAEAAAQASLNDANSVASLITWLLAQQDWEHCKRPVTPPVHDIQKPVTDTTIQITNGTITATGGPPEPQTAPTPQPVPVIDPHIMEIDRDFLDDIEKAADRRLTTEIGMLEIGQSLDLREILNSTDTTTYRLNKSVDPLGGYVAASYHWKIPGSDFMLGVNASLNFFGLKDRQYFSSGSYWGTRVSGYGTLTGELLYAFPSLRNVGFFAEAGGALASQSIAASFAPAFSKSDLVPGAVIGGGIKVTLQALGAALGHPVLLNAKFDEIFLADQTASPATSFYHYSASSQLSSFSIGLAIAF